MFNTNIKDDLNKVIIELNRILRKLEDDNLDDVKKENVRIYLNRYKIIIQDIENRIK